MGWRLDRSVLDELIELESFEQTIRRGKVLGGKANLPYVALCYAVLKQLGFDTTESSIFALLQESIDALNRFHTACWWTEENARLFAEVAGLDEVQTRSEVACWHQYAPENRHSLVIARETIGSNIIAALATDNQHALQAMASFYPADMEPMYYGGKIDELYQRLMLLMMAKIGGVDTAAFEEQIAQIRERPLKMSTSLQELIAAVFAGNQSAFDELLPDSISIRNRRWETMGILDHISLEHSIVIAYAESQHMTIPKLSKKRRECILRLSDLRTW